MNDTNASPDLPVLPAAPPVREVKQSVNVVQLPASERAVRELMQISLAEFAQATLERDQLAAAIAQKDARREEVRQHIAALQAVMERAKPAA